MAKVTYLPHEDDPHTTEIMGHQFKADQTVEIDDAHAGLLARVSSNPWFHVGDDEPPLSRRAHALAADAKAKAAALRDQAEALDPSKPVEAPLAPTDLANQAAQGNA